MTDPNQEFWTPLYISMYQYTVNEDNQTVSI